MEIFVHYKLGNSKHPGSKGTCILIVQQGIKTKDLKRLISLKFKKKVPHVKILSWEINDTFFKKTKQREPYNYPNLGKRRVQPMMQQNFF